MMEGSSTLAQSSVKSTASSNNHRTAVIAEARTAIRSRVQNHPSIGSVLRPRISTLRTARAPKTNIIAAKWINRQMMRAIHKASHSLLYGEGVATLNLVSIDRNYRPLHFVAAG